MELLPVSLRAFFMCHSTLRGISIALGAVLYVLVLLTFFGMISMVDEPGGAAGSPPPLQPSYANSYSYRMTYPKVDPDDRVSEEDLVEAARLAAPHSDSIRDALRDEQGADGMGLKAELKEVLKRLRDENPETAERILQLLREDDGN